MWQYHLEEGGALAQAQCRTGLQLAFGQGLESSQPDLAGKGGEHQAESDHRREERIDQELTLIAHGGQQLLCGDLATVIDDQQGQQLGQAAEHGGKCG
ncbi:hypothetical protein D3C75_1195170 [compost metagenome]